MILVLILLPFLCGIMYRMGGSDKPYFKFKFFNYRAMIGIPVGVIWACYTHSWIPLICILTYWFQPPYGTDSYLNFLGEYGKWAACGFIFGISSTPAWLATPYWWMALVQGIIGILDFTLIHYLNTKGKIQNPWEERVRGFLGTVTL